MSEEQNQIGDFELIKYRGCGSFATVYEARKIGSSPQWDKLPSPLVALKLLEPNCKKYVIEFEINAISSIPEDESLMKTYGYGYHGSQLYIISELLTGSDYRMLSEIKKLSEDQIRRVCWYVTSGALAMHEKQIIHRDIKPRNVMQVSATPPGSERAKLIDFGLIHDLAHGSPKKAAGTPRYMAPEQLYRSASVRPYRRPIQAEEKKHITKGTKKTDVWSVGITAMELFTGQPAYQHLIQKPVLEVIQRMFKVQISDLDASFEAKHWFNGVLQQFPDKRYTMRLAHEHPWIQGRKMEATLYKTPTNHTTSKTTRPPPNTLRRITQRLVNHVAPASNQNSKEHEIVEKPTIQRRGSRSAPSSQKTVQKKVTTQHAKAPPNPKLDDLRYRSSLSNGFSHVTGRGIREELGDIRARMTDAGKQSRRRDSAAK